VPTCHARASNRNKANKQLLIRNPRVIILSTFGVDLASLCMLVAAS
jgi:hypothetical protein